MVHNLTNWLISSAGVSENDRSVIEYGLEQGLYSLLGILATIVAGYIFGFLAESLIFIIALIPLRVYAGGYHASSRKKCILISTMLMIVAFYCIHTWNISKYNSVCLGLVELLVLYFLIPIDGSTVLDDMERIVYQKKGRIIIVLEAFVFIMTLLFSDGAFIKVFVVMFSVVLLLVLCGLTKNKLQQLSFN